MIDYRNNDNNTAFLVCVGMPEDRPAAAEEYLDELQLLADTMGFRTAGRRIVRIDKPSPRFLIGSGKAAEIAEEARDLDVPLIIFDDDLSPSQQRNWEEMSGLCVIDRREVILDIFASRARSSEARLQVELAELQYSLPRLRRAWTHLARQRGGSRGTRGEGEKQLEIDRRRAGTRIARLKQEIKHIQSERATMRKNRKTVPVPTGSIVGYTNAGKSSLLNLLTGAELTVENKLFATLDPTTRRISLSGGTEVLLTDTVGFIRKLPHGLIDAFKSTLEETVLSDFLLHVVDVSNPDMEHHMETTGSVLREIGAGSVPQLTVFNKTDRIRDTEYQAQLEQRYPDAVFISVKTGSGIEELKTAVGNLLADSFSTVFYTFPLARSDLAALVHRTGRVLAEDYSGDLITIQADVPQKTKQILAGFAV